MAEEGHSNAVLSAHALALDDDDSETDDACKPMHGHTTSHVGASALDASAPSDVTALGHRAFGASAIEGKQVKEQGQWEAEG